MADPDVHPEIGIGAEIPAQPFGGVGGELRFLARQLLDPGARPFLRALAACLALMFAASPSAARDSYLNDQVRSGIALATDACARYFRKGESPAWLEANGFASDGARGWTIRVKNESTLGRQRVSTVIDRKGNCYVTLSHSGRPEVAELDRIALQRIRAAGFREAQGERIDAYLVKTYLVAGSVKLDYSAAIQSGPGGSSAVVSLTPVQE